MDCEYLLPCMSDILLRNPWIILSSLTILSILFSFFSHKPENNKNDEFLVFFSTGWTALIIGYLSSLSRHSGIPDVVAAITTIFGGYLIFEFFKKSKDKKANIIDIKGSSLCIIFFVGYLLYGSLIGANQREWYEKLSLPEKWATQEHMLKTNRKDLNLP